MYCTICGKDLPDDAIVCSACGSPTANFHKQQSAKLGPAVTQGSKEPNIKCPRCSAALLLNVKKCPGCGGKVVHTGGGRFIDGWPGVLALAFFALGLQQLADGTLTMAIVFETLAVLFLVLRFVIPFIRTKDAIVIKEPFDLQPWMLAFILPLCWTVVFAFDIIRTFM